MTFPANPAPIQPTKGEIKVMSSGANQGKNTDVSQVALVRVSTTVLPNPTPTPWTRPWIFGSIAKSRGKTLRVVYPSHPFINPTHADLSATSFILRKRYVILDKVNHAKYPTSDWVSFDFLYACLIGPGLGVCVGVSSYLLMVSKRSL